MFLQCRVLFLAWPKSVLQILHIDFELLIPTLGNDNATRNKNWKVGVDIQKTTIARFVQEKEVLQSIPPLVLLLARS